MCDVVQDNGQHARLRRDHGRRLLEALQTDGPMTRRELASRTAISRTTTSDILAELLTSATIVIVPDSDRPPRRGRPAQRFAASPKAGQVLGIDFGHRRVRMANVDTAHEIVAGDATTYPADADWPERLARAEALLTSLGARDTVSLTSLRGVGIGLPGPWASARQTLEVSNRSSVPVATAVTTMIKRRIAAPVLLDNHTRFAALAEAVFGGGSDTRDLIYVRLADGVGGGLVIGGRLATGSVGSAGEIGHVCVRRDGAGCRCGKRGCLETVASTPAVLAACAERGIPLRNLTELAVAVRSNDPVVDRVLSEAGDALGRVLGALAVVLDPAEVVVGGELVDAAPLVLERVRAALAWELPPAAQSRPVVRTARLGDNDGVLGAAAAVFHASPLLQDYPEPGPASAVTTENTDEKGDM